MDDQSDPWFSVAWWMAGGFDDLDLTAEELARRSDLPLETIEAFLDFGPVPIETYQCQRLSLACGWSRDSVEQILAGGFILCRLTKDPESRRRRRARLPSGHARP